MAETAAAEANPAAPEIPAWRYRTGLGLFIFGNLMLLASVAVAPALGISAAFIGIAVLVSEGIALSSMFFLGWAGMKQLKNQMFAFLKHDAHAPPVGKTRHRLGVWMTFILPLLLNTGAVVLVFIAYERAVPADPFPKIFGLTNNQFGWTIAGLFLASYVSLMAGIFVLGDHWWGRFREVFVWQGDK